MENKLPPQNNNLDRACWRWFTTAAYNNCSNANVLVQYCSYTYCSEAMLNITGESLVAIVSKKQATETRASEDQVTRAT